MFRPRFAVTLVSVVLAVTGCTVLDRVRRPPPVPSPPVAAPPVFVRIAHVPAPPEYRQTGVMFADSHRGAALFVRCAAARTHDDCTAILLTTVDGGVSWQRGKHPRAVADGHRLTVGPGAAIALRVDRYAWYVSTDRGATFRRAPYAPESPVAPAYDVCCEPTPRVRHLGVAVPVAPRLPGPPVTAVFRPGRELWAGTVEGGRAYTAVSTDHGRTWTPVAVPDTDDGRVSVALRVSPDGADLWLLAARDQRLFPAVWKLGPGGWTPVPVPESSPAPLSTVPLDGGLLALTGTSSAGVIDGDGVYRRLDWPSGGSARLLDDGTLELTDPGGGSVWLGAGVGVTRDWSRIVLVTTGRQQR
jgi:hypothetical protein